MQQHAVVWGLAPVQGAVRIVTLMSFEVYVVILIIYYVQLATILNILVRCLVNVLYLIYM